MNIGILGGRGRVGQEFLSRPGLVDVDIDVTNKKEIKAANLQRFDVVINCSAKTRVDECEKVFNEGGKSYFLEAMDVNTKALELLRAHYAGRLIHLSTDYIFDGTRGPYSENADRAPLNNYGYTKWGGEIVLETYPEDRETIIVRTTGLFGSNGDFVSLVVKTLRDNQMMVASSELHGNHTYIPHLVDGILSMVEMKMRKPVEFVHIASDDIMSRYDFAIMVANVFGLSPQFLAPVKNKDIPGWVAKRPSKGGLKVSKAKRLGVPIYTTLSGLQAYARKSTF